MTRQLLWTIEKQMAITICSKCKKLFQINNTHIHVRLISISFVIRSFWLVMLTRHNFWLSKRKTMTNSFSMKQTTNNNKRTYEHTSTF